MAGWRLFLLVCLSLPIYTLQRSLSVWPGRGHRWLNLRSGEAINPKTNGSTSTYFLDKKDFLNQELEVIDAVEAHTGYIPRKSTKFFSRMSVRQVPGDGSCLFHSIVASLPWALNGTHHCMDISQLRGDSYRIRQQAVDCLENNGSLVLFIHGSERSCVDELLAACAQQYNITEKEYCRRMRNTKEWGGGPEIVVLSNLMKRPIHIYGLDSKLGDIKWRLRRISVFGSPKFDRCNKAIHILSADSRFPQLTPGKQLAEGNHFLALFPVESKEETSRFSSWSWIRSWFGS